MCDVAAQEKHIKDSEAKVSFRVLLEIPLSICCLSPGGLAFSSVTFYTDSPGTIVHPLKVVLCQCEELLAGCVPRL